MKRLISTTAVASVAALALLVAPSQADFNIGYYTHRADCVNWNLASSRIDPVNYVFFNWGTLARVDNQVIIHGLGHSTNWGDHGGTSQSFISHNTCYPMDDQHADHGVASGRNHFREKAIHSDPGLGYTVIADAHHENLVWCGNFLSHAVDANSSSGGSGFNKGRANLTNDVFAGTSHMSGSYTSYFGNTQLMRQCDGNYASSDGSVRMMPIHQINHTL